MRRRFWFTGCFLSILFLAGCSTVMPPEQSFEATAVDFSQRLRWMDYYGAARHLMPEHRDPFLQRFTPLEDLHITDVRLQSAEPQPEGRIRTLSVLEFYLLPSTTVRTFPFQQEWVYQTEGKGRPGNWRIVTSFPDFPTGAKP